MNDIYDKLRKRLDDLATGFPSSASNTELKILKRIFTPDEAKMFLSISPMLETPDTVAARIGKPVDEVSVEMDRMSRKGLLFRQIKEGAARYAAVPYVVGIFEFQLNSVDADLAHDMDEYFTEAFGSTIQSFKTPIMRTIPIKRDLVATWPVAPYEDVMEILAAQKTIAVAPCICRTTAKLNHRECDKPVETCFLFGSHAQYYVGNGMGRFITLDEARDIVKKNDEAGLVMQPFNAQKAGGMCSCCGDCCGVLRSLKMQKSPAAAVQSNYYAAVEREDCNGCGVCADRCQMEAIALDGAVAVVDRNRCIGCGLCATGCSTGAARLMKKAESELYTPPVSGADTYIRIAKERGKL